MKISRRANGFTVIELLVALAVLITIGILAFTNIRDLQAHNSDSAAKTDINVIYHQLEAFHQANGYYPKEVSTKTLPGLDPETLKDSNGLTMNSLLSMYAYKPIDCKENKCDSFKLSTALEKEPIYEKSSESKS